MLELVKYIVEQFAEYKDEIVYDVQETDGSVTITVYLAESDMGKVIGKQGKIAKALRTLVRSASANARDPRRYNVEIKEKGKETAEEAE